MSSVRRLDDHFLVDIDGFARHTGWLYGYATYGLLLFALLLAGLRVNRSGSNRATAAELAGPGRGTGGAFTS